MVPRILLLVSVLVSAFLTFVACAAELDPGRNIPALLKMLDAQIEEGHMVDPRGDNAAQTFETISAILGSARPADVEMVIALPSHFAERAQQAQAAGREAEARRFRSLAGMLVVNRPDAGAKPASAAVTAGSTPSVKLNSKTTLPRLTARVGVANETDAGTVVVLGAVTPRLSKKPQPSTRGVAVSSGPQGASSPLTLSGSSVASSGNPRCLAISQKFEIGMDLSDAEQSYLRGGCAQ